MFEVFSHMRDNANGLTNHVLATSGLGFKMFSEYEKSVNNVLSVTKKIITKTFLDLAQT